MSALRLSLSTLSVLPVGAQRSSAPPPWGPAMLLAPVVGILLGAVAWLFGLAFEVAAGALVGAVVIVAVDALLTRGLHLDGLADVADGLGSRLPPQQARAVMKRSDVGAFGVVAVVLVALLQVSSLGHVLAEGSSATSATVVIGAAALSRGMMTWCCRRGAVAAGDGMGRLVVGTVSAGAATLMLAVTSVLFVVLLAAGSSLDSPWGVAVALAVILAALAVGVLWQRHCHRRLGGVTGDVLGSVQQLVFTAVALGAAMLV
jgi:adenosylcobinamide-GDP ribazoletransferase